MQLIFQEFFLNIQVTSNGIGSFKLLRDVTRGKHDVVVVNYQDRLSWFGISPSSQIPLDNQALPPDEEGKGTK
ncbi:MAG: hypothetical protein ACTSUE_00340 [Promethearchaeota archaeon]